MCKDNRALLKVRNVGWDGEAFDIYIHLDKIEWYLPDVYSDSDEIRISGTTWNIPNEDSRNIVREYFGILDASDIR